MVNTETRLIIFNNIMMNYGRRFRTLYRRQIKTIPMEKKCKKAKRLSEEALQMALKGFRMGNTCIPVADSF